MNRRVAWLLVVSSIVLIVTGYGQSIDVLDRRTMRDLHVVSEWAFIALLSYHALVGTLLARYRYSSSIRRILARSGGPGVMLRFALRATSWPLLILSGFVIASGLSWYGILIVPFNQHIELDALFFIFFTVHTAVGAGLALKRLGTRRSGGRRAGENEESEGDRRGFIRRLGGIGVLVLSTVAGYSLIRSLYPTGTGNGNGTAPDAPPYSDSPVNTRPSARGQVSIRGRVYSFDPTRVDTVRPDIFRPGFFSIFDVLVHLHREGKITLEYHFDESMNANLIDRVDGEPNWWYQIYYTGGWPERSAFRPDHYPWKDGASMKVLREDPARIEAYQSTWREEIRRLGSTGGKVLIPNVYIQSQNFRREFRNVEVTAHNLRRDMFQDGVITALDVILSLADQKKISYGLKWYESIGRASVVKDYWVEKIDSDRATGGCGYVYEAGDLRYRRFSGNHIHLPAGSRAINSPEYVELFWICL